MLNSRQNSFAGLAAQNARNSMYVFGRMKLCGPSSLCEVKQWVKMFYIEYVCMLLDALFYKHSLIIKHKQKQKQTKRSDLNTTGCCGNVTNIYGNIKLLHANKK